MTTPAKPSPPRGVAGVLRRVADAARVAARCATGVDAVAWWHRDYDDLVAALGEDGANDLLTACYRFRCWP